MQNLSTDDADARLPLMDRLYLRAIEQGDARAALALIKSTVLGPVSFGLRLPSTLGLRRMKSKFEGECLGCGNTIAVGAPIEWLPTQRSAFHPGCLLPHIVDLERRANSAVELAWEAVSP